MDEELLIVLHSSSTMGSVAWVEKFKMAPTQSYKICKAALHMLNAQYALDFADAGFTFLCVSPGVSAIHFLNRLPAPNTDSFVSG